ncbi:MAG: hypothetical protein AAF418_03865 [Pseudomonadota bacterium]
MRVFFTILVPLLTPFICYWLFMRWQKKNMQKSRVAATLLAGLGAAVLTLLLYGLNSDQNDTSNYQPAQFKNGKIIEGRFESDSTDQSVGDQSVGDQKIEDQPSN